MSSRFPSGRLRHRRHIFSVALSLAWMIPLFLSGPAEAGSGGIRLWTDGVIAAEVLGIPNETHALSRLDIGSCQGIDLGTQGVYRIDGIRYSLPDGQEVSEDFENGDLGDWSAIDNQPSRLSVGSIDPLAGLYDLRIEHSGDAGAAFLTSSALGDHPSARIRFLLDTDELALESGQTQVILRGFLPDGNRLLYLYLADEPAGGIALLAKARRDDGTYASTPRAVLGPGPVEVVLEWWSGGDGPSLQPSPVVSCDHLDCAFDASATVAEADTISFAWDFGDGVTAHGAHTSHRFALPGEYEIGLTVADEVGQVRTVRIVQAVTEAPPVADFFFACRGLGCTSSAALSTDDVGPLEYRWDFGDGSTGRGEVAAHAFATPGAYPVTLIVKDGSELESVQTRVVSVAGSDERVWIEDHVPPDAILSGTWDWRAADPVPVSGALYFRSPIQPGVHQQVFRSAAERLEVGEHDVLFANVYLDPADPPRSVMLQWHDPESTWHHRAVWGEDLIPWGVAGTDSRRLMGPLPATGGWVRLEVPAELVGAAGSILDGMAFTLYDGSASWDRAGVTTPPAAVLEPPEGTAANTTGIGDIQTFWSQYLGRSYIPNESMLTIIRDTAEDWTIEVRELDQVVATARLSGATLVGPNLYDLSPPIPAELANADARLGSATLSTATGAVGALSFQADSFVVETGERIEVLVPYEVHPDLGAARTAASLLASLADAEIASSSTQTSASLLEKAFIPVPTDSFCADPNNPFGQSYCGCVDLARDEYDDGIRDLWIGVASLGVGCATPKGSLACVAGGLYELTQVTGPRNRLIRDLLRCWGDFRRDNCNQLGELCPQDLGLTVVVEGLDPHSESVALSGSCGNAGNFTVDRGPVTWFGGTFEDFLRCPVPYDNSWYPFYQVDVSGYTGPTGWAKTCTSASSSGTLTRGTVVVFDCQCAAPGGCEGRRSEISARVTGLDVVVGITLEAETAGGLIVATRDGYHSSVSVPSGETYNLSINSDPPGTICVFYENLAKTLAGTASGQDITHSVWCRDDPAQEDDDPSDGRDGRTDPNGGDCKLCGWGPPQGTCGWELLVRDYSDNYGNRWSSQPEWVFTCSKSGVEYRGPGVAVVSPGPDQPADGELSVTGFTRDADGVAEFGIWIDDVKMPIRNPYFDPTTGQFGGRIDVSAFSSGEHVVQVSVIDDHPSQPMVTSLMRRVVVQSGSGTGSEPEPRLVVTRTWDGVPVRAGETVRYPTNTLGHPIVRTFRMDNHGDAPLSITGPESYLVASCFEGLDPLPAVLDPGSYASIRIAHSCSTAGWSTGVVTIQSNDPEASTFTFDLESWIEPTPEAELRVTRTWDLHEVAAGSVVTYPDTSAGLAYTRKFRISNDGDATLSLSNPAAVVSGSCWVQSNGLPSQVAAGSSATVDVALDCTTPGDYSGTVTIRSDDPDEDPFVFHLLGTVLAVPPDLTVLKPGGGVVYDGTTVAHSPQSPDDRIPFEYTIRNDGGSNLHDVQMSVSGPCWSIFSSKAGTTTPGTLAPGQTGSLSLLLSCTTPGSYRGTVTISSSDPDESPFTFSVDGELVAPLELAPSADAHTRQLYPNGNYGGSESMYLKTTSGGDGAYAYLKFDVSDVTGPVTAAYLEVVTGGQPMTDLWLYQVLDTSWSEYQIAWTGQPGSSGVLGAESNLQPYTRYRFDVSSYVQGNGTYAFGFANSNPYFCSIFSRESTAPPVLIVEYSP